MSTLIDINKTKLLSAEDICEKISISRSTFDRWRRNQNPLQDSGSLSPRSWEDFADKTSFPPPCINIGGSPRWQVQVVNDWINANGNTKSQRGKGLGKGLDTN